MANEWSQELLNELNRAGQEFENAALAGDSRIPVSVQQKVAENVLYRYYQEQQAARKANRGRTAHSYLRDSVADNVANPVEYSAQELTAARNRVSELQNEVNRLKAAHSSPYVSEAYKSENKAELENKQSALALAQQQQERMERDTARARQATQRKVVDEAAERGVSYKGQYEAYGQSLKEMYEQREQLRQQLSGLDKKYSRVNSDLDFETRKRMHDEEKESATDRLEKLTREIERLEGQRNYASLNFGKDKNAAVVIKQGEELARTLKDQYLAGNIPDPTSNADYRAWADSNTDKTARDYAEQQYADREPNDLWTQDEKNRYFTLMTMNPESAFQYAVEINSAINREVNERATSDFSNLFPNYDMSKEARKGRSGITNALMRAGNAASDVAGIAGGVATGPVKLFNWLDNIYQNNERGGYYAVNNTPRISDYTDKLLGQNAERLNSYGTISSDKPVFGGKGLGDLYQLVESVAQSMAYGAGLSKVFGVGATTAAEIQAAQKAAKLSTGLIFFGQAADSSYNEYVQRGMSREQAVVGSFFAGLAETAGEELSIDHLISGDISEGLARYVAKQSFIEASEEGFTDVLNLFGDKLAARLTGGKTQMLQDIEALKSRGMSDDRAKRQVWKEFVDETVFDMFGGAFSGGLSAGLTGGANKLWEMRKGSVLGKESAEGQREGGKKNASNDELSKMFDRALKRGDIRGAEQILQVIEQRGATAEEQEYGPVDPTANERMRKRLERQLNGESLNPETENAEAVEESATNRQLAEEARVQAEFPTVSPITMELVRRLDGKDFVTMAKSMTTQELAEVARYARYIGENAKADLLEQIRLDPTYRYEEQTPAHTDEDDLLQNGPQNVAGQQAAPAGQITQPSQQNAAQTVKPGDSATAENRLFNVAQNPNGVSTTSTESGTMSVPNTQEVTTNAGEQAVQQSEEAEAADFGVGRRPAGAGAATGQRGVAGQQEAALEGAERRSQQTDRALPRFVSDEDVNELSDVEESAPITQEQKNEYSSLIPLTNNGIQVVSKPQIGSRLHLAWSLAKKLGQKVLFARNYNGSVFKDGSIAFQSKGNVIVDADNTQMELSTAVAHEAGHDKYFKKFGGYADIVNGAYTKRLNFFTGVFNDALGAMRGLQVMRTVEQYIRDNKGYGRRYDRSRERYTREVSAKITNPLAQNATNLVAEMEKARSVEEFMNQLLALDRYFLDSAVTEAGISGDDLVALRKSLISALESQGILTAEEIAAINDAARALEEGNFTDDLSDEEESFASEDVDADAEAASFENGRWYQRQEVGLNKTLNTLISGNTEAIQRLSEEDLLGALKYIMDKGLPKGQSNRVSKGQAFSNLFLGVDSRKANNATAWTYERGYQGGTFYGMNQQQKNNMLTAAEEILTELTDRGYPITSLSDFTKYANGFGILTNKKGDEIDLSTQPKSEENTDKNAGVISMQEEDAREAAYDRRNKGRDLDALAKAAQHQKSGKPWKDAPKGTNYVKEAIPTKPEDQGWIKPVDVSEKEVKRARDAVEAKGKEAELKDRIKTLEAQKSYLTAAADAMRKARSDLYGSENIEQRKSDLGYIADGLNEQLEQLDADLGYVADGVIGTEEEAAIDNILAQKDRANAQLDALRDEYTHLSADDSATLRNVRSQIDSVVSEIAALSRQLDGVSKRAERADWGANKRTLFQAEMAENPDGIRQDRKVPEPNRYGPYSNDALNRAFRGSLDVDAEAADFGEPTRGMGTGYAGMQRSRNKDGSLEFRTMYDDALPTRPATDKSQPLAAPSTAYSNVAQAARSILNSKSSFLDFSKDRPKDIPSKVTNTMGQLREHVREMMEGDHPVNALMQLSNMVHEFENDNDLKVFSSDSIKKAVDELNDIYYNQDITNEEKARRMVENATKTLTLISKRVQLVDRGYNMLKTFTGPKKKRDNTTFWSKYKAMQLNPSTLFKAMDGFARDKNGSGYQIAKMIENGTALYTITQTNALKRLSDISSLEGFKEFSEGNATPFDIDGVKITEQQAVEFIMQVRNLRNINVTGKNGPTNRLNTIDGFSIMDKNGKSTFIERSEDAGGTNTEWFLNLAEAMENSLSPAAKKYLETATDILDDLGRQTSDMRTNLIGTGFEDSINGTYYTITYGNKNGKSNSQQSNPAGLFSGPSYQSRTRNVGGYVNIKNVSDTMDKYIHWASNTIGYGEVAELLQVMNSTGGRMQNLSTLANEMLGQGYSEYISKFVDDVNEVPDGQKNNNSALAVLRRNMASGALLGNLGVAAKQAASLWSGVGVLSPQALLSAETYFGGHTGAGNVLLQSRLTGTSLDPTISEILHNDSFMGNLMKRSGVTEFMGKAAALVDYQTVKRLFAATVVDTKLSFPGMDQNSELFAKTVEAKFQDVVIQTQPIFVKNARSGYLRSNDELMKAFAMFRTQPAQNLNAIVTAVGEYNAMKGTEFGKAAGKKLRNTIIGQTASAITFATLSAIVGFARHGLKKYRDDDDEISWAEVAKRIGLDSINSLANITVVGGDIAKAIIDIATGGETREFNDVNAGIITMLFDTLSSVTTFGTNVVKAIKDDQPLAVFNAGRQAADNLLQLKGIPANTIYRLLNTVTMYSADALRALSGGKLGNRAMYDDALKMLDSYIRGDLTEEGAKAQAAKAFRKDQPENLLYNLGILSSLTKEGSADKGTSWLNTRIQGKTEAERETYKEDELARLGRNLNAGERIANYLADSALSAAQKDEAISKFATTSGYNVLYESLRAAGMTPKAAVEELGKTENKAGLSTDIRSDDSLADLYAGKDSPGETNDVPALDKKNTDEYVNFVSAMKVFRDTGNYIQLDKLVDQYSKLDDNTRAVIEAKDSTIGKYREYRSMGFSTKDYYNVKDAIKQAQVDLDLAANTGTAVKLVGLSKTNLSKAQIQKLVNSDTLGISKTGKSLISVLGKYGYTVGDIGMFMYNTDWTNDDANGTLSQQEVVLALAKEKRLTEAQKNAIYEELKPLLRNEYKISHWYDKSYEDELNYLLQNGKTSGRAS